MSQGLIAGARTNTIVEARTSSNWWAATALLGTPSGWWALTLAA